MPYRCCVPACRNPANHRFPSDRELYLKWVSAIGRPNWTPTSSSRICAAHFVKDDFFTDIVCSDTNPNKRIRRGAIPSIFVRREDYERVSQSKVSKKLKKKDHESSETTFKIVEKVLLTYFH